jgi:hypothetical protein
MCAGAADQNLILYNDATFIIRVISLVFLAFDANLIKMLNIKAPFLKNMAQIVFCCDVDIKMAIVKMDGSAA